VATRRTVLAACVATALVLLGGALWWLRAGAADEVRAPTPHASAPAAPRADAATPAAAPLPELAHEAAPAPSPERLPGLQVAAVATFLPDGERGQAITGLVIDGDGRPVRDARVELLDPMSAPAAAGVFRIDVAAPPATDLLAEAATGHDGRFRMLVSESRARVHRHVEPGGRLALALCRPLLRATRPGLRTAVRRLAAGEADVVDVGTLVLGAGGGLRGRVLHASGAPVSDARVNLRSWITALPGEDLEPRLAGAPSVRTGPDGRFEAGGLPPARTSAEIELEG
jgi:hypothetical protein